MTYKKLKNLILSLLLAIASLSLTISAIEIYMRHNPKFGHGADHNAEQRVHRSVIEGKPEGKKRIVIIGDSLTYGDGIKLADTFPYKLQQKLDNNPKDLYQVINMGIMGADTKFQAEILVMGKHRYYWDRPALSFDPDIVILAFCVNDIEIGDATKRRPKDYSFLPEPAHKYLIQRYRLYKFLHGRVNGLLTTMGLRPSYTDHLKNIYMNETEEWNNFTRLLNFMIFNIKIKKKDVLLVIYPALGDLSNSHPYLDLYEKVSEIGRSNNTPVLNLFPYFKGKDTGSLVVSYFNGHPNGKANEIVSEAIYNKLVEENMI